MIYLGIIINSSSFRTSTILLDMVTEMTGTSETGNIVKNPFRRTRKKSIHWRETEIQKIEIWKTVQANEMFYHQKQIQLLSSNRKASNHVFEFIWNNFFYQQFFTPILWEKGEKQLEKIERKRRDTLCYPTPNFFN